jgi:hypothetical protein
VSSFDPAVLGEIGNVDPMAGKVAAYKLADLVDQEQLDRLSLTKERGAMADAETVKGVLARSDISTPEGVTKASAELTRAGQPKAASDLMRMGQERQLGGYEAERAKYQAEREKLQLASDHQDAIVSALDPIVQQLDDLKARGVPDQQLDSYAQRLILPAAQQLAQSRPELAQHLQQFMSQPGAMTYRGVKTAEEQSKSGQALLKQHMEQREQTEIERHNKAMESAARDRIEVTSGGTDDQVQRDANLIATYRMRPPTGRSASNMRLMSAVSQINPDYDATRFDERNKAVTAFGTGKQGDTVRSLNVGVQHLGVLGDLANALDSGNKQAVNKLVNAISTQFGVEAPADFNAAKQIVGDEIVKSVQGSGSAGAQFDRENVQKQLDAVSSPRQLAGVIKTYKSLMSGQLRGLRQQYKDATGLENFNDKLDEQTIAELDAAQEEPTAAAQPGEQTATGPNGQKAVFRNGKWVVL